MALLEIPVRRDLPAFEEKVELSSVLYTLTFHWNERMALWLMDLADAAGEPLIIGMPLLADAPVNGPYIGTVPGAPLGSFYVVDETDAGRNPDLDNFGDGVTLVYSEP